MLDKSIPLLTAKKSAKAVEKLDVYCLNKNNLEIIEKISIRFFEYFHHLNLIVFWPKKRSTRFLWFASGFWSTCTFFDQIHLANVFLVVQPIGWIIFTTLMCFLALVEVLLSVLGFLRFCVSRLWRKCTNNKADENEFVFQSSSQTSAYSLMVWEIRLLCFELNRDN